MFDVTVSGPPSLHSPTRAAWGASAAHVMMALVMLLLFVTPRSDVVQSLASPPQQYALVWFPNAGPGGGGGGGDRSRDAGAVRERGLARRSAPPPPPAPEVTRSTTEPPTQTATIGAVPVGSAMDAFAGVMTPASTVSTAGPGDDHGAGTRPGGGNGDGPGGGVGNGRDQGSGGVFGPGNNVSMPQLLRDVKPRYTADAMRAKIQGVVLLECVVLADGRVGDVRILKSLDALYGLDAEAVAAARKWQFQPGRRFGEPVAVRVVIELAFRLR